jgi:hypothetical protein
MRCERLGRLNLRQALSVEHHIVCVARAGPTLEVARSPLIDREMPTFAEQSADITGADEIGRVKSTGFGCLDVDVGVVHDEQVSSGRHRSQQRSFGLARRSSEQGRVGRSDQVESGRGQRRIEQTSSDPLHVYPGLPGCRFGALQGNFGDVEPGDLPALAGQPDGVRTFTAADIQRPARFERRHFDDQGGVRLTAPELLGTGIPPIPFRVVVHPRRAGVVVMVVHPRTLCRRPAISAMTSP